MSEPRIAAMDEEIENQADAEKAPGNHSSPEKAADGGLNEFDGLRRLLFSQEQEKISQLENEVLGLRERLGSLPPASAKEVSDVLPDAINQSARADSKLHQSTLPVVEENIRQSVKDNPQVLAEALFPVIGPAIRKAIAEALAVMVQSMNQTIEHSLSPKSLKWRLESFQTGKPFAEIVLLKTLLYRVEQIFLIHRETGLMLQHAAQPSINNQDADMVSAMLTAIQDFVKDSFSNSPEATLDNLQVGELAVWIERSSDILFAAVIRGNAPLNLREEFKEAVEKIELSHEGQLDNFKGETEAFDDTRPILEECLKFQAGAENGKEGGSIFSPVNVIGGILGIAICVAGFFWIRDYWRWSDYLAHLRNESGIVVVEAERGWFKHAIQGLKDPLAPDPVSQMKEHSLDPDDIDSSWDEFQSSRPEMILLRAKKILEPPEGVTLSLDGRILYANGSASADWFEKAREKAGLIFGVNRFGIEPAQLITIQKDIEKQGINFICGTTQLEGDGEKAISEISSGLASLHNLARDEGKKMSIEAEGHATPGANPLADEDIGKARAGRAVELIKSKNAGLKDIDFSIKGIRSDSETGCKVKLKINLE